MVKVREDLTGQTFGRLTVIEQVEDYINQNGKHRARWKCQCECSNVVEVVGVYLKNSKTQSCGCLNRERIVEHTKKCNDYEVQEDYVIMYTCNNEPFLLTLKIFGRSEIFVGIVTVAVIFAVGLIIKRYYFID